MKRGGKGRRRGDVAFAHYCVVHHQHAPKHTKEQTCTLRPHARQTRATRDGIKRACSTVTKKTTTWSRHAMVGLCVAPRTAGSLKFSLQSSQAQDPHHVPVSSFPLPPLQRLPQRVPALVPGSMLPAPVCHSLVALSLLVGFTLRTQLFSSSPQDGRNRSLIVHLDRC